MKSSKELGTSSPEIQEATATNTQEPTLFQLEKEKNKHQIETGKLNIISTILKMMFYLVCLMIVIFFLCESIPSCQSENMLGFFKLLLDGFSFMGPVIGYILGSRYKDRESKL